MNKKVFLGIGLALCGIAAIVVIFPLFSSIEAIGCEAAAAKVGNFEFREPPEAVVREPFVEDGDTIRTVADYQGKRLVMNFWATWCGPCKREMPSLDRLRAEVADEGILVLALSEDREGASKVREFYRERGIENLPVLVNRRGVMRRMLGIANLPMTLLVDARGFEIGRMLGVMEWDSPAALTLIRSCLRDHGAAAATS